jgi:hypothetical protein
MSCTFCCLPCQGVQGEGRIQAFTPVSYMPISWETQGRHKRHSEDERCSGVRIPREALEDQGIPGKPCRRSRVVHRGPRMFREVQGGPGRSRDVGEFSWTRKVIGPRDLKGGLERHCYIEVPCQRHVASLHQNVLRQLATNHFHKKDIVEQSCLRTCQDVKYAAH